MLKESGFPVE